MTESTAATEVGPAGLAYRAVRERITSLVSTAPSSDARVPACPEWRVHDVVSHCAGVIADVLAGNIAEAGSEPWTAAQVESRRARPTEEVLDEWAQQSAQIEAVLDSFGPAGNQLLMDVLTHELDLRQAVGAEVGDAAWSDALALGLGWLVKGMTRAAKASGHPVLRVRSTDGREWTSDEGPPVATITASPLELLRACTGRRSARQIRAMDWEGDVDAVLPAFTFGPFRPPPD